MGQAGHDHGASAKLVQVVRAATHKFIDVNNAGPDYTAAFGCVSGPGLGAMGIHYINGDLVGDGEIDAEHPEALVLRTCWRCPAVGRGRVHCGCSHVVDKSQGRASNARRPSLSVRKQSKPVRHPSLLELHVWASRDNPGGAFVDWNNKVSCEGQ